MVKIVAIALLCVVLITYLKAINSDLFVLALVGSGVIIFTFAFEYLAQTYTFINNLISASGIDKEFYLIIFKVASIGYLIEFSADTITDLGFKSIADKLVFVGKIVIFSISLPILYALFNLITGLI